MLGRLIRSAGRLLAFICVARFYSMEEVGSFAYLMVVGTLLAMLTDFGLTQYLTREIPASGFKSTFLEHQAAVVRILGLPLAIGIGWLAAHLLDHDVDLSSIGTLAFASSIVASDLLAAMRRGHGRYQLEALECSLPLIGLLAVALPAGFLGVGFASFQLLLGGPALFLVVLRLIAVVGKVDPADKSETSSPKLSAKNIVHASRWLLLRALLGWALFEILVVLVKHLADARSVALYASAMRPAGLLSQSFLIISMVFLPSLSYDLRSSQKHFDRNVRRFNLILLCFGPAGIALCTLGGKLLLLAFGESYLSAEPILMVLALAFAIHFSIWSPNPLVVIHREYLLVISLLVGLILVLFLGALLIPTQGAMGAAIAALIALGSAKVIQVLMYVKVGLPLGDWKHGIIFVLFCGWTASLWLAPDNAAFGITIAGGTLSLLVSLRLMLTTRIFSAGPVNGETTDRR